MSNIKKRDFYNAITGDSVDGNKYGIDAEIFKKTDNVNMLFDSRGSFLGIMTCRGKFINGRYTCKRGIYDFKSFLDLKIWAGQRYSSMDFIEAKEGVFLQIDMTKRY